MFFARLYSSSAAEVYRSDLDTSTGGDRVVDRTPPPSGSGMRVHLLSQLARIAPLPDARLQTRAGPVAAHPLRLPRRGEPDVQKTAAHSTTGA
ncbi:hypothetical protein MTO96_049695 [Rhipicephalus appendiculatus]